MGNAELLGSELEESKEQPVQPSWPKKQHFKIIFCIFGLAEPARFGGENPRCTAQPQHPVSKHARIMYCPRFPPRDCSALSLSQSPSQKGACWTSGWASCPPG